MIWDNTRRDDLIIRGLKTRHKSNAQATAGKKDEDALLSELLSLEKQFFKSQIVNIQTNAISACHTLPRKGSKTKLIIVMCFIKAKDCNALCEQKSQN